MRHRLLVFMLILMLIMLAGMVFLFSVFEVLSYSGAVYKPFPIGQIAFALLALGVLASAVLSRRYIKPITDKLSQAVAGELPAKLNIVEIDRLFEKVKELHSKGGLISEY
jgi:membrane protein implicated in regulation of membrane protease activity